jgi:hypothetical protein
MADLSAYRTQILAVAGVVGRHLIYNDSVFDNHTAGVDLADDLAIAPDKSAYRPGDGLATYESVSSYSRGINGIAIDLASAHGSLSANDFTFKVGNGNAPETWIDAPTPTAISVRPGAGANGTDRIEILWENGAIINTWLQVTIAGNDAAGSFNLNTGLAASDVFYFGNKIADSGSGTTENVFVTNSTDSLQVFATAGADRPITDLRDYNRDGIVNATDSLIVFASAGTLKRIEIGNSTATPQTAVADGEIAAVSSRLAAPLSTAPTRLGGQADNSPLPAVRAIADSRVPPQADEVAIALQLPIDSHRIGRLASRIHRLFGSR